MRCGASKAGEGNLTKTLPCNDECARLERNRKLAVALNIDQSTHVDGGDHIPFSTDTLNFFAKHTKWAQDQERELRVFATSEDEKRLRLNPMKAAQRAFVHSLADDFGFDSESVDPEPHRHALIWKTPRFVSAPSKTLADALRLRQLQKAAAGSANVSDNEGVTVGKLKAAVSIQPYNGFVIKNPRFALTLEEVRSAVNEVLGGPNPFAFDIEFLPSEEVVLKAITHTLTPIELERVLQNARAPLTRTIAAKGYGSTQLCCTDSSLNITRLESDLTGGDGWSRVAAKKVAPRTLLQSNSFTGTNSFAALSGGGKITFARKKSEAVPKLKAQPVVDDWEAAELAEEEKERVVSANVSETEEEHNHIPDAASSNVDDEIATVAEVVDVDPESWILVEDEDEDKKLPAAGMTSEV